MPKCPNCNYELVLIPNIVKYKCSKCGKLFPQRDVDNITFQRWNKKQRDVDKHNLKVEKIRSKLTEEEKDKRAKLWREKNIERIKARERELWYNGTRKIYLKEYYQRDLNRSRLGKRIKYYRLRQKLLALQMLEKQEIKAYTNNLFISPPTYLHYQLLSKPKVLKNKKLA
ncbi:hypothetical protein HYX17_04510 [Candidatus Woesearchaeota archaeon]|nr:hypothetical protein [Candidatus Woesearchaeota archaeon]